MALSYSTGLVHNMLNTTANGGKTFGEAFNNGVVLIYGGTRASNADGAVGSAPLLGMATLNGGAFTPGNATNGLQFGTAANRTIDKSSSQVWQFTGLATGTATWFRIVGNASDNGLASTSLPRLDGTIAPFGGDITLRDSSIVLDNVYTINQALLTWPAL